MEYYNFNSNCNQNDLSFIFYPYSHAFSRSSHCYSKASSNGEVRHIYRLYEKKGQSYVFAVLTKVIYIVEHYLTIIEQATTDFTV